MCANIVVVVGFGASLITLRRQRLQQALALVLALVRLGLGMVRDLRYPLGFLYWFEDGVASATFSDCR